MKKALKILSLCGIIIGIHSCGVNSNLMLKTDKDYEFADLDSLNTTKLEYKIDINDILQLRFFTNDGIRILDATATTDQGVQAAQILDPDRSLNYIVRNDSLANLPIIGETNLVGMTIREAEIYLSDLYKGYYIDPFVQISVTNKRVIVFPGNGGEAQVLYLSNPNTTLMEAIALAGGITERGRSSRVKLIRKTKEGKREVYKIDLSTIDGLEYTDIIVQANDYIYVEPVPEVAREVLREVAPIVSLISSAAVIISVVNALSQ
jgi:polysaccharide export outer membrane protein